MSPPSIDAENQDEKIRLSKQNLHYSWSGLSLRRFEAMPMLSLGVTN
jgi:hypothetical protein